MGAITALAALTTYAGGWALGTAAALPVGGKLAAKGGGALAKATGALGKIGGAGGGIGVGQAKKGVDKFKSILGFNKQTEAEDAASESEKKLRALIEAGPANKMRALQIPTLAYDRSRQEQGRRETAQIEALQESGAAGVIGGTTALAEAGAKEDLSRQGKLAEAEYKRDLEVLGQEQAAENLRYKGLVDIEMATILGAQAAAAGAADRKSALMGNILGALPTVISALKKKGNPYNPDDPGGGLEDLAGGLGGGTGGGLGGGGGDVNLDFLDMGMPTTLTPP